MKSKEFQPKIDETLTDASAICCQGKQVGYKGICLCKSDFKTHVEKLNPTFRTDLSHKTLFSILN